MDPVLEKVRELTAQMLRLKLDDVGPDASLTADLAAESVDLLELRFLLEKAFKIPMGEKELREAAKGTAPAEMARNFTCRSIAAHISARLPKSGP